MNKRRSAIIRIALPVVLAGLMGPGILGTRANAAPAHHTAQAPLSALVLTTRDVTQVFGGGFKAFINGVISNKDLASAVKTAGTKGAPSMALAGRVTGYDSVWFRGGKTGYLSVTNAVNVYQNDSFPQNAFSQIGHYKPRIKGITFHFSTLSGVGDQAAAVTIVSHGTTAYGIVFRRGRYLAEVLAGTQHGQVNTSNLLSLAAIEDHRLQSAG